MASKKLKNQTACQKQENQTNVHKHIRQKSKNFKKKNRGINQRMDSYFVPQPFGDASHCAWFWKNYYSALEWQERHHIAYWKSRSIALEYENNILHQYLQMYACNDGNGQNNSTRSRRMKEKHKHAHSSKRNEERERDKRKIFSVESNDEKSDENEFEFQITEEMMDFFEQSIRHKMELQKQREKEKKEKRN
ncbi:hypothetical protein L9F63_018799 [Diploptera punctata]|uniref:Gem-associated protein 8 n=1 Tax=Diploptera punctata TaxID=6984 RepID=A0AAD8EEW6_DIPPU|nr:hypothetical protein L9F63_018799 [Diploptera punctata]